MHTVAERDSTRSIHHCKHYSWQQSPVVYCPGHVINVRWNDGLIKQNLDNSHIRHLTHEILAFGCLVLFFLFSQMRNNVSRAVNKSTLCL